MHRTGLAPHGQDDDAVRWAAIGHAPDHIHIVATLARQDGTRPRFWNDYYRFGEACRAAEQTLGLRRAAPHRRPPPHPRRIRKGPAPPPPRTTPHHLRRAVSAAAATATSEQDFFTNLAAAGIAVRKRFSTRGPGEVTGYAVALPIDTTRDGAPVWYSGGKLAVDPTLPKLRHRWPPAHDLPGTPLTNAERSAIWTPSDHPPPRPRPATEQRRSIRKFYLTDRAAKRPKLPTASAGQGLPS